MTHRTVRLHDGTTVRANEENLALVLDIDRQFQNSEAEWVKSMRALGAKAGHPDDGWVRRNPDGSGKVHLEYPRFNDGLGEGDLLALGAHYGKTRIVRVTKVEPVGRLIPMTYYHFVQVHPDPHTVARLPEPSSEYRPGLLLRLFGVRS